jgi:cell division protein FtsB
MKLSFGKTAVAALALMAVVYGVGEFRGPNGYTGLLQKREQVRNMEQENAKLRAEIDRLDKRVDRLQHDPAAQELEIRRRLNRVKPGETVYVLQDAQKPQAQPATLQR